MALRPEERSTAGVITLPASLARRVQTLAKNRKTSANRVLVELIETGFESKEAEKAKFFDLADQLSVSSDPVERNRIKELLARMIFGE